MGARLHGAGRDAKAARDLGDRPAAVVALQQHGAVVLGQVGERLCDDPRQEELVVGVVLARAALLGDLADGRLGPGLPAAPVVDDDVAGHREEPRADGGRGAVEDRAVAPGPQQRLLGDVLGAAAVVADEAQAEAPEHLGVLVVHPLHQRDLVLRHPTLLLGRTAASSGWFNA